MEDIELMVPRHRLIEIVVLMITHHQDQAINIQ
jgi:hypothetical protein